MEFTVEKIADSVWAIAQQGVRAFLFAGPQHAVLVDTCFGGDLLAVCRALTDRPITLITTHADPDHIGCDAQFAAHSHYLHSADLARYAARSGSPAQAQPVRQGERFEAGDYCLEVIEVPGHTPGSIALLDRRHGILVAGDTVQSHCIYMHGEGRDLHAFRSSIAMLEQLRQAGAFHTVYASHGEAILPADILTDHLALADALLQGTAIAAGPAPSHFPATVKIYRHGRAQMYYEL